MQVSITQAIVPHAKAGAQEVSSRGAKRFWIPASAGMTILLLVVSVHAATDQTIRAAASGLKIVPAPQLAAIGEAGFALPLGLAGFWLNPASIRYGAPGQDLSLAHAVWGNDISLDTVSGDIAYEAGTAAFGFSLLNPGVQERRTADGFLNGDVRSTLAAFHVGFARELTRNLYVGGALRALVEELDTTTWTSASVDLGLLWNPRWNNVTVGLTAADLGAPISAPESGRYVLPARLLAGIGWQPLPEIEAGFGFEQQVVDQVTAVRLGGQYRKQFGDVAGAIRLGYRYAINGFPGGPTAGLGMEWNSFALNYAYVPYSDVATVTHRVSLDYHRGLAAAGLPAFGELRKPELKPAPESLFGLPGIGSMRVVWQAPHAREKVLGYNVYLVDPATHAARKLNAQPLVQAEVRFPRAAPEAPVSIAVAAVYAAPTPGAPPVEGRRTDPVRIVPRKPGDPPHAPQGLTAQPMRDHVVLRWLPNEGGDVAGYWIYAASSAGGPFTHQNHALVRTPLYSDSDVAEGTDVYYYVTAVNPRGREGPPSETIRVVPN